MRFQRKNCRWPVLAVAGVLAVFAIGAVALAGSDKDQQKGWLGVYLHDVDDDTKEAWNLPAAEGAIVDDVAEDSPAEKAGLEPGDVIVKFDGQPVTSTGAITRMIRKTKPQTPVKLEIIRDGKSQELTVTLGEDETEAFVFDDANDVYLDALRLRAPRAPRMPGIYEFYGADPPARLGVQLRQLTGQLAEYFGVQRGEGVLVEEVQKDSPAEKAGIRAGDVIVAVGGEPVGNTIEVVDELRDYDDGDTVAVAVVRKGVKQTLTVAVKGDDQRSDRNVVIRKQGLKPRGRTFTWDSDEPGIGRETMKDLRESIGELREELKKAKEELWKALRELQEGKG